MNASPRSLPVDRKTVRDSLLVTVGGQLERALGTITALSLRWGLNPEKLGVYTGLRLYLDNTNRSSLGIGLGAVQEIPILRAAGRHGEATHLANVTYTTNTITCAIFSAMILALAWSKSLAAESSPLNREWVWGLVAVAILALIKRQETFLVAMLRAHREFALTAELDVIESTASAICVPLGLWFAGLWGLLIAVGVLLVVKIAYAQWRHPLRFRWAWDLPLAWRLMWVGLPILANTAAFGFLLALDRMVILWRMPDGERAAGLYLIAIMGTSWSLDLAGRIVLVLYNTFQTTLGRTNSRAEVVRQSILANEIQATILFAGASVAFVVGPGFLGFLMPRYVEGLDAIRPLLPGSVLLALAWPARQVLITLGKPLPLFLATLVGFVLTAIAGIIGVDHSGIVGLAWGMSLGYATVFLLTTGASIIPWLGWRTWAAHLARLTRTAMVFLLLTPVVTFAPIGLDGLGAFAGRVLLLLGWLIPTLCLWGHRHQWGGLLGRWNLKERAMWMLASRRPSMRTP